jgi:LacI family gluconate utilization system Gnt-I transcriptional repressor
MQALNFVPNRLAGSLAARTSRIVPVIVPTMANSIFSDFIEEVTLQLDAAGFMAAFGCSNFDPDYEQRLLKSFLGWHPSAVILTGGTESFRALCAGAEFPVIEAWSLPARPIDRVVGFSNFRALHSMVLALQDWGYEKIGFGYIDTPANERTEQRRQGWEAALRERGKQPEASRTQGGWLSMEDGGMILRTLLERHPDTDAIAFASDVLAVGAILECHRLGLRVPEDMAITGCGDMDLSIIVNPALTTVHVPGRQLGRTCAQMIMQLSEGTYDGPKTIELGTSLIRRGSA